MNRPFGREAVEFMAYRGSLQFDPLFGGFCAAVGECIPPPKPDSSPPTIAYL